MMDFNTPATPKAQSHKLDFSESRAANNGASRKPQQAQPRPRKRSGLLKLVVFICIAAAAIFGARMLYRHIVYAGIDTARYQAVYLTNDNVYFGKVHMLVNGDIFLTDVFRVQAASTTSNTGQNNSSDAADDDSTSSSSSDQASAGDIRLIKPGKELHAPDDTMLVKRNNVLFIENLQTNGKVTQAILDYHKQGSDDE